jgi:hypothetical protein
MVEKDWQLFINGVCIGMLIFSVLNLLAWTIFSIL